eukprot:TRINITY_DN14310_c0_g1_i7.p1 TRINITY_DN14310_c0_g1~~TRINITY_DN14310_c0_g1_i7.p1  ORF type:complete len:355 (-),score=19.36 TRINITY_DN14310_c0_g1_i7:63-1127(-)
MKLKGQQFNSKQRQERSVRRQEIVQIIFVIGIMLLLWRWWRLSQIGQDTEINICESKLQSMGFAVHEMDELQSFTKEDKSLYRSRLYEQMSKSLTSKGLNLQGELTQGMSISDIFEFNLDGSIKPILHPISEPVRAVVLPFVDSKAQLFLNNLLKEHLLNKISENVVWTQKPSLFHSTVWHASTSTFPVKADGNQVIKEQSTVEELSRIICPQTLVLDRVVITPSGNVVACWQVLDGTEISDIRQHLEQNLPNVPPRQYQVVQDMNIVHTTIARIVKSPTAPGQKNSKSERRQTSKLLQKLAQEMTEVGCGFITTVNEVWYVQEWDFLALALNGKFEYQSFPFSCNNGDDFQIT